MNVRFEGRDIRIRFQIEEFEMFLTNGSYCQKVSFGSIEAHSIELRIELGEKFDFITQMSDRKMTLLVRFPRPAAAELATSAREGRIKKELTRIFKTDFSGVDDLHEVHLEVDSFSIKSKPLHIEGKS
ncbi:MAG: hypothetical protein RJB66_398 [Pseudomonadota bacterium]|jgi:hypothetical protein